LTTFNPALRLIDAWAKGPGMLATNIALRAPKMGPLDSLVKLKNARLTRFGISRLSRATNLRARCLASTLTLSMRSLFYRRIRRPHRGRRVASLSPSSGIFSKALLWNFALAVDTPTGAYTG